MTDIVIKSILGTLLFTMIGLIVYVIPEDMDRTKRSEQLATEMGCTYIGNARDLNSVKFFQCGDDVVIKRIK